ncbi:hypothetical protein Bca4012_059133 [Brassica carinata]|uniref:Uncharacterized protein n=1 Tax=Brassica carinata TaxID=52824 RepID=A0A8X7W5X6_BRACI|nr:hypothetical protein Bca52824_016879 [Brassica carinata]
MDSPVVKPSADSSSKVEASSKPVTTENSSSDEEETDSETETEKEVETDSPAVKPLADSKIVETSSNPKATTNSLSEVEPDSSAVKPPADSNSVETSQKPATKKRHCEIGEGEAKRVKRASGDDDKKIVGQESKKNYFQRFWTEEDELTVLQGIIDYQNENGKSAFDDKITLYELLKESISFKVTKVQFLEKIRGLKKKYDNNHVKEKKKGAAPAFSKSHDLETYRLSKFVWGDECVMANAIEVDPPVLKLVEPAVKKQEFVSIVESMTRFGVDELVAKKGWIRLSSEDKKRLEEDWDALQLEELRFYSRKSGFIHDAVTKMV